MEKALQHLGQVIDGAGRRLRRWIARRLICPRRDHLWEHVPTQALLWFPYERCQRCGTRRPDPRMEGKRWVYRGFRRSSLDGHGWVQYGPVWELRDK